MRISSVLFGIGFKFPRGHMFRGKNRLVKRVSSGAIETLRKDVQREEENMFYLRHPYLSVEQSKGHAAALNKHEKWLQNVKSTHNIKFSGHKTLLDELSHLKVKEDWDFKAGSN